MRRLDIPRTPAQRTPGVQPYPGRLSPRPAKIPPCARSRMSPAGTPWISSAPCAPWSRACTQGSPAFAGASALGVRGFYQYLNREGLCRHDPAAACPHLAGERRLPCPGCRPHGAAAGRRRGGRLHRPPRPGHARAVLFSGLRLSELVGLDLDSSRSARRPGPGAAARQQGRELPVGRKAREAMQVGCVRRWPTRRMVRCSSAARASA